MSRGGRRLLRIARRAGVLRQALLIERLTRAHLCRSVVRAIPVVLLISAITTSIDALGQLDRFENAGVDAFNILKAPKDPSHVVLIGITDDDHRDFFAETSPLDPEGLRVIIDAIAAGSPRLIAVDIDTSSPSFRALRVSDSWPPIVWGQDAIPSDTQLTPIPVLGGQSLRGADAAGIAALPMDSDGVVRRHLREFSLEPSNQRGVPSFPWAIVQSACRSGAAEFCLPLADGAGHSKPALRLNFSGERYTFAPLSVRYVLEAAKTEGWRTKGPLKGRIAVLGGCYRAARDSYVTPVGPMFGLQLIAQAVESELGGGIRPINHVAEILLDIGAGLILVLIHHLFPLRTALVLSLVAIPALSFCGSYLAFATFARWVNFVPMIVGVLIHQLYDHSREYNRLLKQAAARER